MPTTHLSTIIAKSTQVRLPYTVHSYSSYSGLYFPHNIIVDQPTNQASRWSTGLHNYEQYITIKFEKPVIAKTIIFGKFHKGHVCNLKEFKIYSGMDPDNVLTEILHDGLVNNSEPETFSLKYIRNNMILPTKYLKIVPLSAFGDNFNYSIWFIEVQGVGDKSIVQRVCSEYNNFVDHETTRLCLKYLRQRNMMDVFHFLKNRTGVELEHPLVSALYRYLVVEGNYNAAEQVILQAYKRNNIYQQHAESSEYKPKWRQLRPTIAKKADGSAPDELPCARGGHQMCIDIHDRKIYLFGGWDGTRDLSDFWYYDIVQNEWYLISMDTEEQGGPSACSCHKICFDPNSRSIFILGRYVEARNVMQQQLESSFYRYYIESDKWVKIQNDTAKEGGPNLIFDHQMAIDAESQIIYVFGGRIVTHDPTIINYSGLYSYNISLNRWISLREDDIEVNDHSKHYRSSKPLKSRVGHSLLFDPTVKQLYIFAGQREREYLTDLYRYSTNHDTITEIAQDFYKGTGTAGGFTQRATIDEALQEIYVLSGYTRNSAHDLIRYTFWVYSIERNEWKTIYQKESSHGERMSYNNLFEPCPRFAHQMVYDSVTKRHYVFGGNPGGENHSTIRLGDFWELKLTKNTPASILRKSYFMLRMQRLKELCSKLCYENTKGDEAGSNTVSSDSLAALDYLRKHVAPVLNEDDEKDANEFYQLCTDFCLVETMADEDPDLIQGIFMESKDIVHAERNKLFEKLLEYIPQEMKEPLGRLTDAIKLI
ncbi:MAG: Muskelin N-terminus-domain-containing protein [Benjaminiella poitrasii]|nr:MAG: Muskelin N-terminus-domain-containing protein [Benjaminiella poitrasii]